MPWLQWLTLLAAMILVPPSQNLRSRSGKWLRHMTMDEDRPQWRLPRRGHPGLSHCILLQTTAPRQLPPLGIRQPHLLVTATRIPREDGQWWRSPREAGASWRACRGRRPSGRFEATSSSSSISLSSSSTSCSNASLDSLTWSETSLVLCGPSLEEAKGVLCGQYRMELLAVHPGISSRSQGARVGALRRKMVGADWPRVQQLAHSHLVSSDSRTTS